MYRGTLTKLKKGIKAAHEKNWASPPSWSLSYCPKRRLVVIYIHHTDTTQFSLVMIQGKKLDFSPRLRGDPFFLVLQSRTPRSLEAALPHEPSIPFCTVSSWPSSFWSGLLGLHPVVWDLYAANLLFLPSQFVCNTRLPCIISGKRP